MMALNSYQIAGVLGTTMSGVMSGMGTLSQVGFNTAQTSIQAGGLEASGLMQAGNIMMQSDWQAFNRQNQQSDMMYQAQASGIDKEILGAQSELITAQTNARNAKMKAELNDMQSTLLAKSVVQKNGGVAAQNLANQALFKVNQGIALNESEKNILQSQNALQQSKLGLQAEQATLASKSAGISSIMEQALAKTQANYTKLSSASSAASMRKQASYANQAGSLMGLTQIGASLFSGYSKLG